MSLEEDVARVRADVASKYLTGRGVEIGAGSRPFPVPAGVEVIYGDIRDRAALIDYFKSEELSESTQINAQTFAGIPSRSLDFVISAHVIEHLLNPIGAIAQAARVLKKDGVLLLVVPEMKETFDRDRPQVSIEHLLADFRDGGVGTLRAAYEEHLRFVHPLLTGENLSEEEISRQADESARLYPQFDTHFHAWTRTGFEELLTVVRALVPLNFVTGRSVVNENIFVLRKTSLLRFWKRKVRSTIFRSRPRKNLE